MSAPVEAPGFAALREQLRTATPAELNVIARRWAALPGEIAKKARHLVDEEFEVRLAVQHDIDSGYAALVAEMAPPTRWGTER